MSAGRQLARKFALYGCAGWVLEVLFTGTKAALSRDPKLAARTYLWMHPIYGTAGLLLEAVHRKLARRSRLTRACTSTGWCGWIMRRCGLQPRWASSGCATRCSCPLLAPSPPGG